MLWMAWRSRLARAESRHARPRQTQRAGLPGQGPAAKAPSRVGARGRAPRRARCPQRQAAAAAPAAGAGRAPAGSVVRSAWPGSAAGRCSNATAGHAGGHPTRWHRAAPATDQAARPDRPPPSPGRSRTAPPPRTAAAAGRSNAGARRASPPVAALARGRRTRTPRRSPPAAIRGGAAARPPRPPSARQASAAEGTWASTMPRSSGWMSYQSSPLR